MRTVRSFRLAALTVLPDHWHAVLYPRPPQRIEDIVGAVKQRMWHCLREQRPGLARIWQPRFLDHRIRDEADFARHVFYIRENPGKHEAYRIPGRVAVDVHPRTPLWVRDLPYRQGETTGYSRAEPPHPPRPNAAGFPYRLIGCAGSVSN